MKADLSQNSFDASQGRIELSAFFDEKAEQVRQKFLEEQTLVMGLDPPSVAVRMRSQNGLRSCRNLGGSTTNTSLHALVFGASASSSSTAP